MKGTAKMRDRIVMRVFENEAVTKLWREVGRLEESSPYGKNVASRIRSSAKGLSTNYS